MTSMFYKVLIDNESAVEHLNHWNIEPRTYECYGAYPQYYQGDDSNGNIYFGFFAHPDIVKLADEVNENFKNIKVNIIGTKIFDLDGDAWQEINEVLSNDDPIDRYSYYLFEIVLDDNYSQKAKFMLKLVLAQFMRVYCPYYASFRNMTGVTNNFIDNNLIAQDSSEYGAWICCDPSGNYSCDRSTFNKFDDIELVNTITKDIDLEEMPSIHRFIRVLDGSQPLEYMKTYGVFA